MKRYEIFLKDDRVTVVEADSCYYSSSVIMFFIKIDDRKETVAVFNLENIMGYRKVSE